MKAKILIVEDQFIEAHSLERILIRAGYHVCSIARSVPIALNIIEKERPDLVLLDIYLQGTLTGIDLAKSLNERKIAFVYLSANSNKQVLQDAKATKPYGFLVKPFREKDVLVMLDVAWYLHKQNQDTALKPNSVVVPKSTVNRGYKSLVGNSKAMREVIEQVNIVAESDISVLILGESGTGKELVAKEVHRTSDRKDKPFIVVNCAALPANLIESELFGHEKGAFTGAIEKRIGKFEQANNGTIFLDEIGELPLEIQVKFLRVLQEREFESIGGKLTRTNVRVIAATNRKLEDEIAAGKFRLDLYYRLNVYPITVPPLRDRKSDIPALAKHFTTQFAREAGKEITGISDPALKALVDYSWPGNIRELENIIFRATLVNPGPLIEQIGLPGEKMSLSPSVGFTTMEENERNYILLVLEKCNWKVAGAGGAAEILNVKVSTLTSRMKKLGIQRPKN